MTGAVEELALHAGQSAGLIRGIAPAATIVRMLVEEATAALARGTALLE